jgi:hypothetical protein
LTAGPRTHRRLRARLGRLAALLLSLGLSAASGSASEDLGGTYVLLQQSTVISEVPVVSDLVTRTRSVSIQRLEHRGDRLVGTGRLCQVKLHTSSSMVRLELPAGLARVLPPVVTDARLEPSGADLTFRQRESALVFGARLAKPSTEPLPRSSDDPRVLDQDGDGKPGVTVRVRGLVSGELYIAQRSISSLRGARRGDVFTGRVDFRTEDVVLGSTSKLLERRAKTRPDPSQSFFRMKRAPAGTTCAEAQALADGWS